MHRAKTKLVLHNNHGIKTGFETRSENMTESNSKVSAIGIGIQSKELILNQLYMYIQISLRYLKQGPKPQTEANQANLAQPTTHPIIC